MLFEIRSRIVLRIEDLDQTQRLAVPQQPFAELGKFDRAAEEFSKAVGPDLKYSLSAAGSRLYALLGAGLLEEYRQACSEIVDTAKDSRDPHTLWGVAATASNSFNPHIDSATLVRMARKAWDSNGVSGMALYRDGQYKEAILRLTQTDDGGGLYAAKSKYYLSMSRFSQGHNFQARRLLDEANDIVDAYIFSTAESRVWQNTVPLRALRREATAMIEE